MKDYSINVSQNKKDKSSKVSISGQLNISNVSKIKKELTATLNSKKIDLSIEKVDDIDIAFLQLIESYKTKCKANKIDITIYSTINNDLKLLVSRAGLQNILS